MKIEVNANQSFKAIITKEYTLKLHREERSLPVTVSSSLPESAWSMRDMFSKIFSASHLLDDIHDPV